MATSAPSFVACQIAGPLALAMTVTVSTREGAESSCAMLRTVRPARKAPARTKQRYRIWGSFPKRDSYHMVPTLDELVPRVKRRELTAQSPASISAFVWRYVRARPRRHNRPAQWENPLAAADEARSH